MSSLGLLMTGWLLSQLRHVVLSYAQNVFPNVKITLKKQACSLLSTGCLILVVVMTPFRVFERRTGWGIGF